MNSLKVFGAGSIGNHLAHAARRLGWDVLVCDIDPAALERMRTEIYPSRYGSWDSAIELATVDVARRGGFDLIHIGTPPDSHIPLALAALDEGPRALLIEKPLCPPSLSGLSELRARAEAGTARCFVGYDHVVGRAAQDVVKRLLAGAIGDVLTVDVEFREHWSGIFRAHPWLAGPHDSYLGYTARGGGASGEHSHAANLWQFFAHAIGAGRVSEVDALLQQGAEQGTAYDALCAMHVRTESGLTGRIIQDVLGTPPSKRARIQGTTGTLEWVGAYSPEGDAIVRRRAGVPDEVDLFPKTRPDDFIEELRHIEGSLRTGDPSPLDLERGVETMQVIAAAIRSDAEGRRISINHSQAASPDPALLR